MKAVIKSIHSPDVINLWKYKPVEMDNFCILLEVLLGVENKEGEESFCFEICTPKWLLNHYKREDVIIGKHCNNGGQNGKIKSCKGIP